MREDLPPREYQDLHPIPGDGHVPFGWLCDIDRACTAWLLRRHQLGSPTEHRVLLAPCDDSAADLDAPGAISPAASSKEVAP